MRGDRFDRQQARYREGSDRARTGRAPRLERQSSGIARRLLDVIRITRRAQTDLRQVAGLAAGSRSASSERPRRLRSGRASARREG